MIKINDKKYDKYDIKIKWYNFNASYCGEKWSGVSPFITFNINDDILIGIETSMSQDIFEKIELNKKTDVKKYVTDITYEDDEGWISLMDGKYSCFLTRIDEKKIEINFSVRASDIENIDISISCLIDMYK